MTDLGSRSASQVLRTFLPQQTADLRGGIYRVVEWSGAALLPVDEATIRRRLEREIRPFELVGRDGGLAGALRAGKRVEVVELDDQRGVAVERWPQVWLCSVCKRIGKDLGKACKCGKKQWSQLHFVGFHECGAAVEPWIRRCPTHDDVQLVPTTSTRTMDLRFICPTCKQELLKGLGFVKCPGCQQGMVNWNVHKARSVYTPRGMVLVNPPRPSHLRELQDAGGAAKALRWVLQGLDAMSPLTMAGKPTKAEFVAKMVGTGMDAAFVETLAMQAESAGQISQTENTSGVDSLAEHVREECESQAMDIALALAESRLPSSKLQAPQEEGALADRYATGYPAALNWARLAGVDLVERFPVLNVMYGYTRGGNGQATDSRLVAFPTRKGDGYRLHGDLSETEAYLVRLDPIAVARWLEKQGHVLTGWDNLDPTSARLAIIQDAEIPLPGDPAATRTVGSDLLTLIHSFAHRMIRQTAVLAGIDRDALSEYLVPMHLGFFLYAAPKGEFVLGGMQAVFETELDTLLNRVVDAEHRCPLDPGCTRGGGACPACMHLGEPSCRNFNTYLARTSLFGPSGYLSGSEQAGSQSSAQSNG